MEGQKGKPTKVRASATTIKHERSDISLTPSQAATQNKDNAHKNPLDAISRGVNINLAERRSGLQEYTGQLDNNLFARPAHPKSSGLESARSTLVAKDMAAAVPERQAAAGAYQKNRPQQFQHEGGDSGMSATTSQKPTTGSGSGQPQGDGQPQEQQPQHRVSENHGMVNGSAEPNICTTCPNCHTTLYLATNTDASFADNSADAKNQQ